MAQSRPLEILMVDDDPGDIRIAQEGLKDGGVEHHMHTAHDGDEAMSFLRRGEGHAGAVRPDLVLLDLNMPRKNGFETLKEIKGDPELRGIPVVVLTTSDAQRDILQCYDLHANAYVTKPVDLEDFMSAIAEVGLFWAERVGRPE